MYSWFCLTIVFHDGIGYGIVHKNELIRNRLWAHVFSEASLFIIYTLATLNGEYSTNNKIKKN